MKRLVRGAVSGALAMALASFAESASAWVIGNGPCGGSHYWDPGSKAIRLGQYPDGTWNFPNSLDTDYPYGAPNPNQKYGYLGLEHAVNRWHWFSNITTWSMHTGSDFNPSGTGWYDDGNEQSQLAYETESTVSDYCDGSAWGCTSYDHYTCFWPGVDSSIIAADSAVAHDVQFDIVRQDTLTDCFRRGHPYSAEGIALHELGHQIGLDHENSVISVMNSTRRNAHNCTGSWGSVSFSELPFPDEIQGYMRHHKGYSGTASNFHGTPWWRDSTQASFHDLPIFFGSTGSFTANFSFTAESDYPGANAVEVGFVFVPEGQEPPYDSTTHKWTMNCTNCVSALWKGLNFGGDAKSVKVNFALGVGASSFAVGSYRLWVIMDPDNKIPETGSGGTDDDNAFPMKVMLARFP